MIPPFSVAASLCRMRVLATTFQIGTCTRRSLEGPDFPETLTLCAESGRVCIVGSLAIFAGDPRKALHPHKPDGMVSNHVPILGPNFGMRL